MSSNILEPIPAALNDYLLKYNKTTLSNTTPPAVGGMTNIQWQFDQFGNISACGNFIPATGVGATLRTLGDSLPAGFELSMPINQAFPQLVSDQRGWLPTNLAVGGNCFIDLMTNFNWTSPNGLSSVNMISIGINDTAAMSVQQGGNATALNAANSALFTLQDRAWLTWLGSVDGRKFYSPDFTFTGTWASLTSFAPPVPAWVQFTNTIGSSASVTFNGTCGDLILVCTSSSAFKGVNFTVTCDGVPVVIPFPNNTTTGNTTVTYTSGDGGIYGLISVPMRNLAPGNHTVVTTYLSNDGTGSNPAFMVVGLVASTVAEQKPLVVSGFASRPSIASDYVGTNVTALMNDVQTKQGTLFTQLLSDGFNLVTSNFSTQPAGNQVFWNPNDPTQTQPDGIHPNRVGHQNIMTAFLTALQVAGR